jgi:8-oxo-dGTP pyrophosphatase MutT (NUDIX family)
MDRWTPHVTVAAVVEADGRFLVVEEATPAGLMLNNPAGHLEAGETPEQAAVREVLEETARRFTPTHLLGAYLARSVDAGRCVDVTYLRFAFGGHVGDPLPGRALDTGIVRTLWLTPEELRACRDRHRSPLLLRGIEDHLAGRRLPLDAIQADPSVFGAAGTIRP